MNAVAEFARRLKVLRDEKGLSQSQLADALGVSRGSISYYENGERLPDVDFVAKVREYFHVDYDFLFGAAEFQNAEARSAFENNVNGLTPSKQADIAHFEQQLIECAKAYEAHPKIEAGGLYERMIADCETLISAYKAIVYDLSQYDALTVSKRFMDRIVHTNYPDVIHRISQGFDAGGGAE